MVSTGGGGCQFDWGSWSGLDMFGGLEDWRSFGREGGSVWVGGLAWLRQRGRFGLVVEGEVGADWIRFGGVGADWMRFGGVAADWMRLGRRRGLTWFRQDTTTRRLLLP